MAKRGSGCKGFRALPVGLERLALHADRLHRCIDPGMAQCLPCGPFRCRLLLQAFGTALRLFAHPMRIDTPPRGAFGKRGGRDGAPKTLGRSIFDAIMVRASRDHRRRPASRYRPELRRSRGSKSSARPENAHAISAAAIGQSGGTVTSTRRIERSACIWPMDGSGVMRMRRALSASLASRPTKTRSNKCRTIRQPLFQSRRCLIPDLFRERDDAFKGLRRKTIGVPDLEEKKLRRAIV